MNTRQHPLEKLRSTLIAYDEKKLTDEQLSRLIKPLSGLINTLRREVLDTNGLTQGTRQELRTLLTSIETLRTSVQELREDTSKASKHELAEMREAIADEIQNVASLIPELPSYDHHFARFDSEIEKLRTALRNIGPDEALTKRVDELERVSKTRVQTPAKAYRIYNKDVSAQCDGNNKTFSVGGSHFGIVGVFGTDFPIQFRPIIDYTETRTGIELTSAVPAPSNGATLIIQFLK